MCQHLSMLLYIFSKYFWMGQLWITPSCCGWDLTEESTSDIQRNCQMNHSHIKSLSKQHIHTLPDDLMPFMMQRKTIIQDNNRQSVTCHRRPPTFVMFVVSVKPRTLYLKTERTQSWQVLDVHFKLKHLLRD